MPTTRGRTLAEAVVDRILELVRTEGLTPGDRIPSELVLAKRFSVGRTTVREALQTLAATGVVRRNRRGTVLVDVPSDLTAGALMLTRTTQAVNALYEARRVLEVALASMAATRATPVDLTLMRQEIARLAVAPPDNWEMIVEADMAFHTRVAHAARNEVLSQLFDQVRSLLLSRLPAAQERPTVIQRSVAHHWELYQAIEAGDPVQAADVMKRNLTESEKMVLTM